MAGHKQSYKPTPEEYEEKFRSLRERIDVLKNNINLRFISVNDIPITETEGCINQLVIKYRNGSYDVLPRNINGYRIKDFVGVRYSRIVEWACFPFDPPIVIANKMAASSSKRYLYGENR